MVELALADSAECLLVGRPAGDLTSAASSRLDLGGAKALLKSGAAVVRYDLLVSPIGRGFPSSYSLAFSALPFSAWPASPTDRLSQPRPQRSPHRTSAISQVCQ